MRWDPQQYVRYADERGRPFHELVARIDVDAPRRIVDVGCGPGSLTATLAQRWPGAAIEGLDSSSEMIEAAAPLTTDGLRFRVADAASWEPPADTDIIVSNATLQWVPGHEAVIARWADSLPVGGALAFQVPGNFDSPSHVLMREVAGSPRWRDGLDGVLRHSDAVASATDYVTLLQDRGLDADVWETTYLHVLQGENPVLQWVRGTGLRPVLAALDAADPSGADAAEFEATYAAALRDAYPATTHGTVLPFRRIFAVGHRRTA